MATVADAARPVGAPPPPVRHGICRLTIRIHHTEYRLRPCPPEAGILAAWSLRKLDHDRPAISSPPPRASPPVAPARITNGPAGPASTSAPSRPPASSRRPSRLGTQPEVARQECPPGHRRSRRPCPAKPAATWRRSQAAAQPRRTRSEGGARRRLCRFATGFARPSAPTSPASAAAAMRSAMGAAPNSTSRSAATPASASVRGGR